MSSECAATLNQDSIYERHDVKKSRYLLCRVRLMPLTLVSCTQTWTRWSVGVPECEAMQRVLAVRLPHSERPVEA